MRRLFIATLFVIALCPLTGLASMVRVHTGTNGCGAGCSTALATTPGFSLSAGNTLAVFVRTDGSEGSITAIHDTGSANALTLKASNTTQNPHIYAYLAENVTAVGSEQISVTFSIAPQYTWIYAIEYSGGKTSSSTDVLASKTGTGVSDLVSNSFSTVWTPEVVIIAASQANFATYTAGSSFTIVNGGIGDGVNTFGGIEEYITSGILSSFTAHITSNVTNAYTMLIVSLEDASGSSGGGGTPASNGLELQMVTP